ncbi:Alanyl-tRNA synthetase [hydrothermal vent metagenome]|uniref:Alanine--tRNA ligase n=1 Tax=hydrothermal vent metagenome TaxID=652676 RepID=A0A3B0TEL0_9ZZZZ
MTGVNAIRSHFLDFFAKADHQVVASGPLVPRNDPTLLFTNAGMVQFKNVFTGTEKRPYSRAVTAQKCVRAGGKHNDLDNVGYTARHHTFFEMLGNFSFGDYFKDVAIELAWTLITKEFALSPDRLLVTVFSEDEEAYDLWSKIAGLPDSRIIRIPTSDNFWSMGETGPCGPCSEIFYDHGDHIPGGPPGSPDEDGDRFVEIWNLVFMQYEQVAKDRRIELPRPSIDTGLGLERLSAVLQGTHNNYEIDLMRALVSASENVTNVAAEGDKLPSHRVIADHLRASAFLIADGVLPSNEGRGYVLRRIMRRAMRHGELLGVREPMMWKLVPTLTREMGDAYPELRRAEALITETLALEESRFARTLERGLKILEDETKNLTSGACLAGDVAFKLYDTYGFPLDLTEDALRNRGIGVDKSGFEVAMAAQKAEARAAWSGSGDVATETVWFTLRERHGATEFLGYETDMAEGQVLAMVTDGAPCSKLRAGEDGAIIVNQTPFYGEAGGQVGDRGEIRQASGATARFVVTDTKKMLGDLIVHFGKVEEGEFAIGEAVELEIDHQARRLTRANHSATHLLHEALRLVLGEHVAQKGSLVEPGRLRFDFSHPKPMTADEIAKVEKLANAMVLQNSDVSTRLMGVDEAIAEGALALFGEKYGDEVRVVSMGREERSDGGEGGSAWSTELCGGTHVRRTGDIGLIKIVTEQGVASGVRRIEALTADGAKAYLDARDCMVRNAAERLKTRPADLGDKVASLIEERRKLERQVTDLKRQLAMGGGGGPANATAFEDIGGLRVLARKLSGISLKDLRSLVDEGKREIGSGVVAIVGVAEDGKAGIAVGITDDLVAKVSAIDLVRLGASALGGKGGGGRPDMAQAGGPDGTRADAALDAVRAGLAAAETVA